MQYNGPRYYTELKDTSILCFGQAIAGSFGLSAFIYIAIALAGFLTFGGNSSSYILNNYHLMIQSPPSVEWPLPLVRFFRSQHCASLDFETVSWTFSNCLIPNTPVTI